MEAVARLQEEEEAGNSGGTVGDQKVSVESSSSSEEESNSQEPATLASPEQSFSFGSGILCREVSISTMGYKPGRGSRGPGLREHGSDADFDITVDLLGEP